MFHVSKCTVAVLALEFKRMQNVLHHNRATLPWEFCSRVLQGSEFSEAETVAMGSCVSACLLGLCV